MSGVIKSFSFPDGEIRGDTFYIKHLSNNFTVIDCYLKDGDDRSCRREEILDEIGVVSQGREIRFVSTHPDKDHILGIDKLYEYWGDQKFYAVENETPAEEGNESLTKYLSLKDNQDGPIEEGFDEDGMTSGNNCCGLRFLWPKTDNKKFKQALKAVKDGESPNNISFVMQYSVRDGARYLWMGDMETDMQEEFHRECKNQVESVDVLFHPHHGRKSSAPPEDLLKLLDPQIIVIGNAPCDDINYDNPEKTITQNTAGDIVFVNAERELVHVFTKNDLSNPPIVLQKINQPPVFSGLRYQGSFQPRK